MNRATRATPGLVRGVSPGRIALVEPPAAGKAVVGRPGQVVVVAIGRPWAEAVARQVGRGQRFPEQVSRIKTLRDPGLSHARSGDQLQCKQIGAVWISILGAQEIRQCRMK